MGTIRLLLETLGPARARRNAADAIAARRAEEAVLEAALEAALARLERRERAGARGRLIAIPRYPRGMEHLRWTSHPALRRPVVVAAFEGWNDAGDAASTAAHWLRDRWAPRVFASIDPEDFFDFTATRPQVEVDGEAPRIVWPVTEVSAGSDGGRDLIVVLGAEPQLRWRTFTDQIVQVARETNAELVVTLGALLAEVPHTRPTSVMAAGSGGALGLQEPTYEGPTGIVGVLHDALRQAGIPSASLWAAVPAYVPGAPSPKASLALVERLGELLDLPVVATDLEIASASYERQVTEVVLGDEDMADYLERLEERYDTSDGVPEPASLVEEVERFLRDHRPPG